MNKLSRTEIYQSPMLLYPAVCTFLFFALLYLASNTPFHKFVYVIAYMIPVISVSQAMDERTGLGSTQAARRASIASLYRFVQATQKLGYVMLALLALTSLKIDSPAFQPLLIVIRVVCASCWYGVYIGRLHYDLSLQRYAEKDQYTSEKDLSKRFRFLVPRCATSWNLNKDVGQSDLDASSSDPDANPSDHDTSPSDPDASPSAADAPPADVSKRDIPLSDMFDTNISAKDLSAQNLTVVLVMALVSILLVASLSYIGFSLHSYHHAFYVILPFLPVLGFYLLYQINRQLQAQVFLHGEGPLPIKLLLVSIIMATLLAFLFLVLYPIFKSTSKLRPLYWPHYMLAFYFSLLSIGKIYAGRDLWQEAEKP